MSEMKKIVVLTGAGISAESGISTFRDSDGLWNNHRIEDVATYEAWVRNQELVLDFYNQRRKQLAEVDPNEGHLALKKLEEKFDVHIITQNVDNLHERAGSTKILHLHGELTKVRSSSDENLIYDIGTKALKTGDMCEKGSQLRPHIVWFGEMVPAMTEAVNITRTADILIIVGTSLVVYPAAGLVNYVHSKTPVYLVDPKGTSMKMPNLTVIEDKATTGMQKLLEMLM
jgi:NAD-dependent deacetylase